MSKTWLTIIIVALSLYQFFLGFCGASAVYSDNIILALICAGLCGLGVTVVEVVYDLVKHHKKSSSDAYLGDTLTSVEEDGSYSLSASSLYEAIEKLGYIEHEMHLEVSKDGNQ